eukprot:TRINITY_DN18230_c0_g1_i1.p1 TRINITY_DN18230_c0_g1~~TRINITY_DN18230_c0_g1_i1.p1  ORF type:complete len:621 (+),score=118.15 TRINITY_DN18230_c0_g1_i1:59-1864(+)
MLNSVEERLAENWTFWRDEWSEGSKPTLEAWKTGISTVAAFWDVFNRCAEATPSGLSVGQGVHLFKDGIRPEYEDSANIRGGHFSLVMKDKTPKFKAEVWLKLVTNIVLKNNFKDIFFINEINGLSLSQQKSEGDTSKTVIKIWLVGSTATAKRDYQIWKKERKQVILSLSKMPTQWSDHSGYSQGTLLGHSKSNSAPLDAVFGRQPASAIPTYGGYLPASTANRFQGPQSQFMAVGGHNDTIIRQSEGDLPAASSRQAVRQQQQRSRRDRNRNQNRASGDLTKYLPPQKVPQQSPPTQCVIGRSEGELSNFSAISEDISVASAVSTLTPVKSTQPAAKGPSERRVIRSKYAFLRISRSLSPKGVDRSQVRSNLIKYDSDVDVCDSPRSAPSPRESETVQTSSMSGSCKINWADDIPDVTEEGSTAVLSNSTHSDSSDQHRTQPLQPVPSVEDLVITERRSSLNIRTPKSPPLLSGSFSTSEDMGHYSKYGRDIGGGGGGNPHKKRHQRKSPHTQSQPLPTTDHSHSAGNYQSSLAMSHGKPRPAAPGSFNRTGNKQSTNNSYSAYSAPGNRTKAKNSYHNKSNSFKNISSEMNPFASYAR